MAKPQNIARTPATVERRGLNPNQVAVSTRLTIPTTAPRLIPPGQVDISKVSSKARQTFGIKEGQTTATGLEKAIFVSGDAILKAQFALDGVFYGKFQYEGSNKLKKAIDKGVVNVINEISEIDLCQILNYALQQVPGSEPFDPNSVPSGSLELAKYKIQKAAYDTQLKIDSFYSSYLETNSQESKAKGVYDVITQVKDAFKEINDPEAQSALRDQRLIEAFPQIGPVNSFLEKAFNDFNRYTDYRQIPVSEVQKLIDRIEKIRAYTILIQGLSTPANAISFVDSVFPNANIQEAIQRLQNIIDPNKLMPLLKTVLESLKKVQSICNVFMSFVTTAQSIIRIVTLIIKVLKIVVKFLSKLPIPNTFTVLGITTTVSSSSERILKSLNDLQDRLNQINTLLSLCVNLFSQLSIILFDMIAKVNRMIVSLESCSNADPTLIKDMKDISASLQNTAEFFDRFVKNHESKVAAESANFGNFTIQIVTEEVVDDAINLRRRYGVALATNGVIVAKSSPTFASDNLIIINEVKAQLASQGYIKQPAFALSIAEANTISESLSYLFDDDITLNDIEFDNFDSGLDSSENEDENSGIGLNAFMNKLQGGKKLRERMRKVMSSNIQQFQKDLKAQDPQGRFTQNIVSQAQKQENKLKIEQLQEDKKKLIASLALNPSPFAKAITLNKIKDIDKDIDNLKKQSQ